ncbi:MAG: D-aminoacylase, partial [Nitrospirae bacterium]|nr:D-aminoacylase [Nitrospirota bacterium]
MKIDLLIKNGLVFDGTGSEPFKADVGISGDRIAFISQQSAVSSQQSKRVIDAYGLAVSPGFIDTHSHSEFSLLADPRAEGKICQGITTEINGNCGLSAAPFYGEALNRREEDLKELGIQERWVTFEEYLEILEKKGIALNFATLVGHGSIRACVIGYKDKKPDDIELKRMQALLTETIDAGAIGISTGLIYPPGVYSNTEELIELCKVLPPLRPPFVRGGWGGSIYTSHMRSEGDRLIESIVETIRIGKESGIKVHISHIKTSGEKNWHKIDSAISMIEEAQKEGIKITCDRYPYTAASTDLDTLLPSWAYEGGVEEELKRLKSLRVQEKIKRELLEAYPSRDYWDKVYISSVISEKNRWMEGKSIAYIAHHEGSEPVDIFFKILIEERLRVGAIFSTMNEDNLRRFLSLPYAMIGTDSSARCTGGPTHKGRPHPRGFGSFPRFLGRYVRDNGRVSMSEAIHRITMLPAKTFGINKRGTIKEGAFADVVVFDHEKIIDRATFDEPFLKPEGIYYVIVNGLPAIWE